MAGRLAGKVVIITGAGSGLGREAALCFSQEGARVVVSDISEDRVGESLFRITEAGLEGIGVQADVRDPEDMERVVAECLEAFGRLDVMFCNAGVAPAGAGRQTLDELALSELRDSVNVNFWGVVHGVRAAVPQMRAQGGGAIVVTSSAGGLMAFPRWTIYCAAKGGVNMLVRALAVELGPFGIRINALCPLYGMSANFQRPLHAPVLGLSGPEASGSWSKEQGRRFPLAVDRAPSLMDNVYGALYLASDESRLSSGVILTTGDPGSLSRVFLGESGHGGVMEGLDV